MHGGVLYKLALGILVFLGTVSAGSISHAQPRMEIEAIAGEPFGVGRMVLQMGPRDRAADLAEQMSLVERTGRVLYPAYETRPVRQFLRDLIAAPPRVTVYFLFQGVEPLDITLYAPAPFSRRVQPQRGRGYERLLRAWWNEYTRANLRRPVSADYPRLVENYLTATLARRLNLPLPEGAVYQGAKNEVTSTLGIMLGTEAYRLSLERDILLGRLDLPTDAELPLPPPIDLPPLEIPEVEAEVVIEPIALRVPAECFYVRFGNFPNFQWLRHRITDWGGDLRTMIAERGADYGVNPRLESQLALRESALADLLGERVVADVALLGTDTFVREGAAVGILFLAKNTAGLTADINRQRAEAVKTAKATEEKITIGDHPVSFLSTPDGTVRSFYVVDGDYHLVTTSRSIAERFLQIREGEGSLGATAEFRHARAMMPVDRDYTAFIYVSNAFFQNLFSPHYRTETVRRLMSASEIGLVHVAQLAARAERKPADSIEDLIRGNLLPRGFGRRADGSRLVMEDGRVFDTLRGYRGLFVPVPDIQVDGVTPIEAEAYQRFADAYVSEWGQMDPLMVGVQREPLAAEKLERVTLDFYASPLAPRHYQFLSQWIGPSTDQRVTHADGDLIKAQVSLGGRLLFGGANYFLFGGLRDADPTLGIDNPLAEIFFSRQLVQGYLGTWPHPGVLRLIGAAADVPVDPDGFSRLPLGIWRRQFDNFTVMSMHPEVLEQVTPQLGFQPVEEPAQFWLEAEDLLNSRLADFINQEGYEYLRGIARGNVLFLHMLHEQLRVPKERSLAVAEVLLDAKLVSPLGGRYELVEGRGGLKVWTTSVLREAGRTAPDDYVFPALRWVRGMSAQARLEEGRLSAHVEMNMPERPQSTFSLPSFSFPGLRSPTKPEPEEIPAKEAPTVKEF